jgi:hypothetical protein
MRLTCATLLALGALVAASPAPASQVGQPPAQPSSEEQILVTGSRSAREPVHAFVESVTVESDDQIAKFAAPICPVALGLPEGQSEVIVTRLRQIAQHLGIGAGGRGCAPNLVVVVSDSGSEFMRRLHREHPALFSMFELSEIREIMRLEGPVRAWQLVEPRGADGRPMQRITFLDGQPPRYIPRGYQLTGVMPSITQTPTRQDLALSFVVFDVEALDGLTLLQIADHAAIRALARTRPSAMPAGRSILGLFEDRRSGAGPADELTPWDSAYLTALYRTMNNVTAQRQRSGIARSMRQELGMGRQEARASRRP